MVFECRGFWISSELFWQNWNEESQSGFVESFHQFLLSLSLRMGTSPKLMMSCLQNHQIKLWDSPPLPTLVRLLEVFHLPSYWPTLCMCVRLWPRDPSNSWLWHILWRCWLKLLNAASSTGPDYIQKWCVGGGCRINSYPKSFKLPLHLKLCCFKGLRIAPSGLFGCGIFSTALSSHNFIDTHTNMRTYPPPKKCLPDS